MANCNYKVNIKDIQSKYSFKIFCAGDNAEVQAEIGNLEDLTTTAKNNLVSAINEVHSDTETNATAISGLQSGKEDKSNKVTSISSTSTDTQYPSAKAVYDSQETQNETISTLETKLEKTKEELDYYKTIYNVLPKVSGNGESITLDNTGESILKLDTRGQCKQDSTNGYNLVDTLATNPNIIGSGLTYKREEDGTIIINGTTNRAWDYVLTTYMDFEAGKTYTFSYVSTGSQTPVLYVQLNSNNGGQLSVNQYNHSSTRAIVETQNLPVKWSMPANSYVDLKLKIMVEEGSTAHDYEPYTGGYSSPSPDWEQQIHEVSGDNEINVCGINLFNVTDFESQLVSGKILNDNGVEVSDSGSTYSKYMIYLKANETYHLKGYWQRIYYYDENKVFKSRSASTNTLRDSSYTPTENEYIQFQINNATWASNKGQEMINIGDTALTYKPYNGDTYELDLGVENIASSYNASGSGYYNYNYDNSKVSKNMTLSFMPNFSTTNATIYMRPVSGGTLYTLGTIATITSGERVSFP